MTRLIISLCIIFSIANCSGAPTRVKVPKTSITNISVKCHAQDGGALPDPRCTPGAFNRAVTQRTINKTICVSGYTATIRPPVSVTEPIKRELMAEYGYIGSLSDYELDHLIPLEIGGAPGSINNLFPEPHYVTVNGRQEGSYIKDGWENHLHSLVCSGQMKLAQARKIMKKGLWINGKY